MLKKKNYLQSHLQGRCIVKVKVSADDLKMLFPKLIIFTDRQRFHVKMSRKFF